MLITLKDVIEKIERDDDCILSQKEITDLENLLQVANNSYWQALGITPVPTLQAIHNFRWPTYYEGFIDKKCAKQVRKVKYCHECIHFLDCLDKGESLILDEKGGKKK